MIATLSPRELWIQALRSGKYKQGIGVLCGDGQYCCLGVACEVYQEHVGDLRIQNVYSNRYYDDLRSILPMKVKKWLMLNNEVGDPSDPFKPSLVCLNDNNTTFEEIANILEKDNEYFRT